MHLYPITEMTSSPGTFGCGVWRAIPNCSNIVQFAITQLCISDYPVNHLNSPTNKLRYIMCSLSGPPQPMPRNEWTQGALKGACVHSVKDINN